MAFDTLSAPSGTLVRLRVTGMDCGSCAMKVEAAVSRLAGVSDVEVSHATEILTLRLDEDRSSVAAVQAQIRRAGYTPVAPDGSHAHAGHGHYHAHDHGAGSELPWWRTRNGRLVLGIGALFALAYAASLLAPGLSDWAFFAAAVVGLVPFAGRALAGARTGTPFSIETLMSVAVIGAIAIGAAEEAAAVVFLFALGELLEGVAAGRARSGIKALVALVPRVARREDAQGRVVEVPAEALAVDDVVAVRPGDRVPSDGVVIEGASDLNEAPVTGESVPVAKAAGDPVFAGSINANGALRIRVTRTAADNTIARIVRLVEQAQGSKAPMARMIDRFARLYTPVAMAAAALAILVQPLFGVDWATSFYRGLAVLLIACPCALVISTPAAIASALAAGARRGLLVKGGAALETLGKVRRVAFDKTGTLTEGRPRVIDIVPAGEAAEDAVLAAAAAVERGTGHPLGLAIVQAAEARSLALPRAYGGAQAMPGKGVTARLAGLGFVTVGSPRQVREAGQLDAGLEARAEALEAEGKTVVVVAAREGGVLGLIALRDEPRADAAEAVARLKALGVAPVMLTGDNRRAGEAVARALGLEVAAELLPDAKLDAIRAMQVDGPVAMVGDGINDAPALAAASVGVAMGGGTDVALETADAALLRDRVGGIAELVALSRAALGNIRQNIAVALGLKALFLVTTLAGATTLWMAILADTGATVLVTANALRLLRRA